MLVKDQMTLNPMCGHADMPVADIEALMKKHGFRRLPIVDVRQELVGLVTRRALAGVVQAGMRTLSSHKVRHLLSKVRARDIMLKTVILDGQATGRSCLEVMLPGMC